MNGKDDQKDEGRKTAAAKPQKPEKVETKFGKSFINRLVGNAIGNIQVTAKLASWQENSRTEQKCELNGGGIKESDSQSMDSTISGL